MIEVPQASAEYRMPSDQGSSPNALAVPAISLVDGNADVIIGRFEGGAGRSGTRSLCVPIATDFGSRCDRIMG